MALAVGLDGLRSRYGELKLLRRSGSVRLYWARQGTGRPFLLKQFPSGDSSARLAAREFEVLRACTHASIPKAIELLREDDASYLVLEDVGGCELEPLDLDTDLRALEALLARAIQWSDALARIHEAHYLHLAVRPVHLRYASSSSRAFLIEFGSARPLGSVVERRRSEVARSIYELLYIAPEQTGRMNRGSDPRSDLYSLGACLYFALAGRPPFEAEEALEVIHAHMARSPTRLERLRPELPAILCEVVHKLLQKQPEDRYQTAASLAADLRQLAAHLQSGESPASMRVAASDVSQRPRASHSMYGREASVRALRQAYSRSARGAIGVAWIRGSSGSGKSCLVDCLRSEVSSAAGYIASGKCDLYTERPYACWVGALTSLCEQLLIESDERLAAWRSSLSGALGSVACALVDLVPELAYVLGDVPALPGLGPRESRQRLGLAVQRFLAAMATREHPLVLFLDDLQWSDPGSRFLLEQVLALEDTTALLVVGVFRDESLEADHPVLRLVEMTRARIEGSSMISLTPLDPQDIAALLADALERDASEVLDLARQVGLKTASLPLAVHQFLEHLHDQGLLRFERGRGWIWDAERIAVTELHEGAVEPTAARISKLAPAARELLCLASCVGDSFSLVTLVELQPRPRSGLESDLYRLCDEGFLLPASEGFRFSHDRIRESAQTLMSSDERAQLHADIAAHLLESLSAVQWEERAFEIADHLNRGGERLTGRATELLVELNLRAGRRALRSGAVHEAARYLACGCAHFSDDDWLDQRELGFELNLLHAEAAFLSGQFEPAIAVLESLDQRRVNEAEMVRIAALRLRIWSLLEPPVACARYELDVLKRLGVHWPLHPSRLRVRIAARLTFWMLGWLEHGRFLRSAVDAPPRWRAAVELVDAASGNLARVDGYLIVLVSSFVLRGYLRRGCLLSPGFTLANYALFAHHVLADGRLARECVRRSEARLEAAQSSIYTTRARFLNALTRAWIDSRRGAVHEMDALAEALREAGDPEYAYYANFQRAVHRALSGVSVPEVMREFGALIDRVERGGHHYPNPEACLRAYRLLVELPSGVELERRLRESEAWMAKQPGVGEVFMRTFWMWLCCVFRFEHLAFEQSERIGNRLLRGLPFVHVADHMFYRGIAASSLAGAASGAARRRYRRELRRAHGLLERWARYSPDLVHMTTLLHAELLAHRGARARAERLFERATQGGVESGYLHVAALACERRAGMVASGGRPRHSAVGLARAIELYERWGAAAKVAELRRDREGAG